ncbi:hypothetical protein [Ruminococcus flavefaciens]|uniref:hypothetical protein n=1 Tax=Ruminococcus flavefaciens TaxID=1265 RepID=UPI0026E944AC|nr:hypothetical protein [Ruminococcus flavefaciens]
MKIDNESVIKTILVIGIIIVGWKVFETLTEIQFNIWTIIIVAIVFVVCIAIITVKDYLKGLKADKKNNVTEALSLLSYKDYAPSDIAQTIDKYFSEESSNIALASFSINGEIIEYYWAVSNTDIDKKYGETNSQPNDNGIPIVFCKDKHSKIDFIIRGSEGELIPLSSSDISRISKINSYSTAYYTCSERKIIGEFLSRNKKRLKSASNNKCTLTIFTKRPPCKYCNDLIEYYRGLYGSRLSFFVFDNLLLNLVNNDKPSHITFNNLNDAVNAVIKFEEKRKKNDLRKRENERNNQLLCNKIKNYNIVLDKYKHIIKTLIIKLKHYNTSPPKKEEIKKLCCITERHKEGISVEEFEKIWEKK